MDDVGVWNTKPRPRSSVAEHLIRVHSICTSAPAPVLDCGFDRDTCLLQRQGGLFPAPYPQSQAGKVAELFRFLGCLLAKALQDGRLVDIPLSRPFLKLLCSGEVGSNLARHYVIDQRDSQENSDSDTEDLTPTEVSV